MKSTRESKSNKRGRHGTWLVLVTGLSLLLLGPLLGACGGSRGSGAGADTTPQPDESAGTPSVPEAPPGAPPESSVMGSPATPGASTPGMGTDAGPCPMQVPGTTVESLDTEDGAGLMFRTSGDLDALRQKVRAMADMHNRMHGAAGRMGTTEGAPGHGGRHDHGAGAVQQTHPMVPSNAAVQEVEGGIILLLTPRDPAQLDALRAHADQMARHMVEQGRCMGMEGWMQPGPETESDQEPEAVPGPEDQDEQEG